MNLELFAAYLIKTIGQIKGKKAFQKLVYLAKAEGVPINHSYRMHYYGPFSDSVAEELESIFEQDIIDLYAENSHIYVAGTKTDTILKKGQDEIKKHENDLRRLLERFGEMTPANLEIYATAHFVWKHQIVFGKPIDRDTVINEIKKAKYPKFGEDKINKVYNDLLAWNLISIQS